MVEGIQKPNFASLLALSSQYTSAPSKYSRIRKIRYTSASVSKYLDIPYIKSVKKYKQSRKHPPIGAITKYLKCAEFTEGIQNQV